MSKYKGIDKETILKIKGIRFPLASKDISLDFGAISVTDNLDAMRYALEAHQKKVLNDTEMSIICEMAMKYLDEFKTIDDSKSEAYSKGLEDGRQEVWELANRMNNMSAEKRCEIFGHNFIETIFRKLTPQEALAKLEAYEKEQAERVKVGDVVKIIDTEVEYVVTKIEIHHCINYFGGIDKSGKWFMQSNVKKTGKHIDLLNILDQISDRKEKN